MTTFTDNLDGAAGFVLRSRTGWTRPTGLDEVVQATGDTGYTLPVGTTAASGTWHMPTSQPSGNDQYVEAMCYFGGTAAGFQMGVRCNTASALGRGYLIRRNSNTQIGLFVRDDAGTLTSLGTYTGTSTDLNANKVRLEVSGSSVAVKFMGATVIGPVTDTTSASGNIAMLSRGGAQAATRQVDDWESGDLGTAAASGTASGSLALSGSAAGKLKVAAVSTGALVLAATTAGTVRVQGGVSGSLGIAGTSAGTGSIPGTSGQATGSFTITGSATGKTLIQGAANDTLTLAGVSAGTVSIQGSADSSLALFGGAEGKVKITGQAGGAAVIEGAATASAIAGVEGQALGSFVIGGSATAHIYSRRQPTASRPGNDNHSMRPVSQSRGTRPAAVSSGRR
jgi:hypothetical protein